MHVTGVRKDKVHSWKRKAFYFGNSDQETVVLDLFKSMCFLFSFFLYHIYDKLRERSQGAGHK